MAELNTKIKKFRPQQANMSEETKAAPKVKLPVVNLPKFDGQYQK